jgi:hypothetical protein
MGESFFEEKKMSAQQMNYCVGLEKTLGRPVNGYQVVGIRTKEPPMYMQDKGKAAMKAKWWSESIAEQTYYKHDEQPEEWRRNTIALVETFLWHYQRGYFPKQTQWCVEKYGKCQYFDVCSSFPASNRQNVLYSGLYKQKEEKKMV